jgi:recombinational DNA repair protein RecR
MTAREDKEKDMGCCGRPNNRRQKSNNNQSYYDRYAYLNSSQRAKQLQQQGSTCKTCAALTMGDPCAVCGQVKNQDKEEQV